MNINNLKIINNDKFENKIMEIIQGSNPVIIKMIFNKLKTEVFLDNRKVVKDYGNVTRDIGDLPSGGYKYSITFHYDFINKEDYYNIDIKAIIIFNKKLNIKNKLQINKKNEVVQENFF